MFDTHCKGITKYALTSPEAMTHVLWFAVATANCPFGQSVNTIVELKRIGADIEQLEYANVTQAQKSAMGCGITSAKLTAYKYLWSVRESVYAKYLECYAKGDSITFWHYIMDCLCGMAMVKAAFACQMLFSDKSPLWCVDIHNARKFGMDKCPTGKAKKNRQGYIDLCGKWTSEGAWNGWCDMLAEKYPSQFEDGEHVSRLHFISVVQ